MSIVIPRAHKFVVVLTANARHYKVAQFIFNKRDGSIHIAFPYFRHTEGIVGYINIPAGVNYPIDAETESITTSNRVKYSHHVDGNVLFSQDGKVLSIIRKPSIALKGNTELHLATIQLQGLEDLN